MPIVVLAVLVIGCATAPGGGGASPTVPDSADPSAEASGSTPVTALELLDCDGPPSGMGGVGYAGVVGGDSPQEAFDNWIAEPIFVVPTNGWELLSHDDTRAMYLYRVGGRIKIVAVILPLAEFPDVGAYALGELWACRQEEFGPDAVFADDRRVWVHADGLILTDLAGPGHCDWQVGRILHFGEGIEMRQYLGDPHGVLPDHGLTMPFDADAELPPDASPSGYRSGDLELWFVPDGRALYVVGGPTVELWPESDPAIGCA